MILLSANSATVTHPMPSTETDTETGTYQVRPMSLIDIGRIELRWRNASDAVRTVLTQHWLEFGAKGKSFTYDSLPAVTLPAGQYTYDEPLSIQRTGPQQVSMRTSVLQSLAYD